MLSIELKALSMLDKCPTIELINLQLQVVIISKVRLMKTETRGSRNLTG